MLDEERKAREEATLQRSPDLAVGECGIAHEETWRYCALQRSPDLAVGECW